MSGISGWCHLGRLRDSTQNDAYDVRIHVLGNKFGNETAGRGRQLGRLEDETIACSDGANLVDMSAREAETRKNGSIPWGRVPTRQDS